MSYKLNGTDIYTTYGIRAGHALGSNIAMRGVFDMPQRTGTTYKDWGDADGVEPWVNAGEMFFAGRDINFSGFIVGADVALNAAVSGFYAAIDSATGISVFETPYNSASGYVKSVVPRYMNGGCFIDMVFREPVVALTGTLPASGSSVAYMIDNIPFSSFGLYLSKPDGLHNLSEPKEQFFTQYGQEGYQIVKRKHKTLEMNGFVMGTSLSDFTSKIQSLYKVFSSSGTRTIVLNTITTVECFATEGFRIENVHYGSTGVIARFHISLIIKRVTYYAVLSGYDADLLTYISGLGNELSSAQLTLLNTFILALKSGLSITNLSDAFDVMYILAGETEESSLRNLVKRLHDITAVGSPTWAALEGHTGATGKYLDTNYNPSTQGSKYTLNNCSLGVYSRTDANGLYSDIGSRTSTSDYTAILSRSAGVTIMRLHNAAYPFIRDAEDNSLGMSIACRNAASETGLFGYHNKSSLIVTNTGNTTNIPNCNIFIGARNNNGTPEQESIRQLSFAFAGRYFSAAEVGVIVDAFEAYMDSLGKGVV
jgi:hypothetical protein